METSGRSIGYQLLDQYRTDPPPTPRSAAMTSARRAATAAALAATLGLATASWVVAVRQMNGMDMAIATRLGSFAFFVALWVSMMAAMMLPGAAPAVLKHAHASGRVRAVLLFVGSYLGDPPPRPGGHRQRFRRSVRPSIASVKVIRTR